MRQELYAPRGSALHRMHPAVKLVLLVVFMIGPFLAQDMPTQIGAIALALVAAAGARVLDVVLRPWKLLVFLFLMTLGVWSVLNAFNAFGMQAGAQSWERSFETSLAYSLRVTSIFLFGLLFLATTRIEEIVHGLGSLGVPHRVAFAVALAFRLVPLFLDSAAAIVEAQEARGLDLKTGSVFARMRRHVPILVPIFMWSLRSADRMAMALEARGFGASGPRTRLRRYGLGPRDVAAALFAAAFIALCLRGRLPVSLSQIPGGELRGASPRDRAH